ncbi:serine-threonine kinase receptor-associated protein isoform X2 [Folsomia candida]|uniref:Serine-threonine kinase receptor-associated protein n=1 Tax=Folsomia candida TaxID=158441 RepID=A0A226EF21_FOLCA|nr:serine-threonine kinase receptor-associated protein isoform X2 [Folsomia candida]OXA55276.1 Serine-threonine kinase receptor-associated protein [Folsomia candida]
MSVRQTPLTCHGHTRPVVHLAFSAITESGYFVMSACKDGKPMLRQGDTGDWIGTFEGHKGAVWGVALNRDGTKAATGAADFSAKIWDAMSGTEIHSFQHNHIVKSVCFNSNGTQLATGSNEKLIRIFDLERPDADALKMAGHESNLRHCAFFGDKCVVSCSDDKTLRLWDINSAQAVRKLEFPCVVEDIQVCYATRILTLTYGNIVAFWDLDTMTLIKEFKVPTQVHSASLKPDQSIFVCGGEDFKIYKYDYNSGVELDAFKGHFGPVHCVRFSPDAELYASGSEDGTLRLWQTNVGKNYGLWKCVQGTVAENGKGSDLSDLN